MPAPVFRSGRVNVQPNNYWSGTEYAPNTSNAWNFNFNNGNQNNNNKTNGFYAWAVRPGDIALVPIPPTFWLLGTALAGLGGRRWIRRKVSS